MLWTYRVATFSLLQVKIALSEKLTFSMCNEKDKAEIEEMEQ